MKLIGNYSSDENYSKGDVVSYQEAGYVAKRPVTGIPPTVDRCWRRLDQDLWDVVDMILDAQQTAISAAVSTATAVIDSRITEDSIALKTETGDYLITVDDSGETPELEITAIEEEEEAES